MKAGYTKLQTSFTRGEVDPLLMARFDLDSYFSGAEKMRNFIPQPQGGAKFRPGLEYLYKLPYTLTRQTAIAPTAPNGGTAANGNDNSTSTVILTTVNISTTNPYVVAKYDLTAPTLIKFVDVVGFTLTAGTSTEFVVQHSADDVTYTNLAPTIPASTTASSRRIHANISKRYWRLVRIGATDLGTAKAQVQEFNLWTETATVSAVKLARFTFSTTQTYVLAFTDRNCDVFKDDVWQASIRTPYTSAQIPALTWTQELDYMIICHEDVATQQLVRQGDHDEWQMDDLTFTQQPVYDFNDASSPTPVNDVHTLMFTGTWIEGDYFELELDGFTTENITYNATIATMEERIQTAMYALPNVSDTGITVAGSSPTAFTITFSGASADDWTEISGRVIFSKNSVYIATGKSATGVSRKENVWSATRGYARSALFFQGRLFFGGSKSLPANLWGSKSNLYFNFDKGTNLDDEAIDATIGGQDVPAIRYLHSGRNLMIMTSSGGYFVPQPEGGALTPNNFSVRLFSSAGIADGVRPQQVGQSMLFMQDAGKIMWEVSYDIRVSQFSAVNDSLLASHLLNSPVDLAYRASSSTDSADWLAVVNGDGTVAMLVTLQEQGVTAWAGISTYAGADLFKSAVGSNNHFYFAVLRTDAVNVPYLSLEEFNEDILMDAAVAATSFPATTISGLTHLAGLSVDVVIDNAVQASMTVPGNGTITLPKTATTMAQAGLPITGQIKTLPVIINYKSGDSATEMKRVHEVHLFLDTTRHLTVDGKALTFQNFDGSLLDTSITPFSGRKLIAGRLGWDEYGQIDVTKTQPSRPTLLALELKVAS